MKQGRKRWLLRLIGLPVLGIVFLVWIVARQSQTFLAIENRSGKAIISLTVAAGGESHTFENIPAGKVISTPFTLDRATGLTVDGQFVDRAILHGRFNFLANATSGGPPRLIIQPWGSIMVEWGGRR